MRVLTLWSIIFAVVLFLAGPAESAEGREVINNFSSVVTIETDGSMVVREEITFTPQWDKINQGLYRDFPLTYSGPSAYRGEVPFEILAVSLDGEPLAVETERHGQTLRILVRQQELLSQNQPHQIVLDYKTSLHLRFYEEYGELNWNVTGTWGFDIESFSALIKLPDQVKTLQTAAWAGSEGSKLSEGIVTTHPAPNQVQFASGYDEFENPITLRAGDQFTVAVSFPLGLIADPTIALAQKQSEEKAQWEVEWEKERAERAEARRQAEEKGAIYLFLFDNPIFIRQIMAFGAFSLFCFGVWWKWGRDPRKGPVIARFHPPQAAYMGIDSSLTERGAAPLSVMGTEYLKNRLITSRGLAAQFVSLAVKGLCTISKVEDKFVVKPKAVANPPDLTSDEQEVFESLKKAAIQGELVLAPEQQQVHDIFSTARHRVLVDFKKSWKFNGLIILAIWFLALPLTLTLAFNDWVLSYYGFTNLSEMISQTLETAGWQLLVALVVTALFFSKIMKAPSLQCRAALDEIEGLALYMKMAENDRLQMFNRTDEAAQDAGSIFQRLLPFALVLGLEKTWCDRFAADIARGILEETGLDRNLMQNERSLIDFTKSFTTALVAAASVSQSSSSSSDSAFSSGGSGGGAGSGSGGGGGGGL